MKTGDILEETYSALSSNKARSGLTILGIVIGIGSVIAMMSIGQGAQSSIQTSIQSIGANLIMVMPGAQRGMVSAGRGSAKTLTMEDVQAISSEISDVKAVAPEVSGRYQVTAKGTNTNTQVYGVTAAYSTVKNVVAEEGNFINDQNINSSAKVAVIGPTVRDDLFGEDATGVVGQTIRINKIEFKIVGVTKAKGGSGFGSQDDMIFVPISTAQKVLSGNKYVSTINVEAQDANSTSNVQTEVTNLLLARHKISEASSADFSTLNQADMVATASSVTGTLTALLGSVAGISLIVGGIGIMNMMLTSVTERTKEIGLRKAIGAKGGDISAQFLTEALALTFIGGLIGIVVGCSIAVGMNYFGIITTSISASSIFLAVGVSVAIGIIFGYYPARRAAKLNPIEALRFE